MKHLKYFFLAFCVLTACDKSPQQQASVLVSINHKSAETICMTTEEEKLFKQINAYRKSKKLSQIPYSASLTKVAKLHAKDINDNPLKGNCNMHSWSDKGKWSSCCYTPDHKKASCMWDKPRELTSYQGNGYEISAFYSGKISAEQALQQWKSSPPHHDVILSKGIWKDLPFNAMGVGIYNGYAMVWFGNSADPDNKIVICK